MPVTSEFGRDSTDLLQLPIQGPELAQLQREFVRSGTESLPVFVHPFAEVYLRQERAEAVKQNLINLIKGKGTGKSGALLQSSHLVSLQEYLDQFQTRLKSNVDQVLVIAEESDKMGTTLNMIRGLGYRGQLLFYRTLRENPRPIDVSSNWGWATLTLKLMMLGMGKVTVGGQYHRNPHRVPKEYQVFSLANIDEARKHQGCVGALTNNILYGLRDLNLPGNEQIAISTHVFDER